MADYSLADLQGAFEGALKSVFGGNSSKNSGAASGAGTAASGAGQSVPAKLFDSLGELAKAGAPVASAFIAIGADGKEAATVFKTFATMAPGVGKSLGGFVETLEQGREADALSGKQGIGNNNILEFAAQAKAGGMTMEGNLKLLKDMGPSLTGIGLNAQDANQRFLKLSQDTIESKLGQSLATAQGGVEGLNAAAAIMAANTKKNLRDDAAGRAELAEASAKLAEQIDVTARVTGKSREVIELELKERLKSPDAILAMNLMSEQQRIAFKQTQASLNEMGPTIGNLAQNIASGARLTKENQSALNALGPAAGEFQRAIRMQQSATTDAQKQQAAVALEAAKAKINEYQSSERYARLALQGSGEVAEMQKKMISENQRRAGAQTTAEQTGQGYQQAQMTQAEIATRQQKGLIGTGERAGQVDEGQTGIRLLNAGQENFRKLAVAGATELVKFNDEFGRSPKLIKGAADAIEFMSGKLGQTSEQKNKELIVPVRDKIAEVAGFNTGAGPNNPVEYSDSSKLKNAKPGQSLTEGKREGGSKAATGNWFEDFGVGKIMELHKKEAVVPEAKLPEFMKDMMSQFSNAGATSQPKPADTDTVKQVNPFEQLTKQLESIKPKQADASPGTQANPFEQLTKQLQSIKMPEIKMPQAPTDMLGQLAGQFKGLTAGMSNIKQPEFPKLPMLPKAAEAAPKKSQSQQEAEAAGYKWADNTTDNSTTQRKKMETTPEDIQTKILDALNQLNKTMGQMVAHTSDISETSSKTARYAGKAGSRTAA
jgi:hypothetical protein